MKKWQRRSSVFLTTILLSANLVGIVPIVKAVDGETEGTEVTAESVENNSTEESSVETLESTESTETTETTEATEVTEESDEKESEKVTIPVQMLGVNDFHGALDTTGTAYLPSGTHRGVGKASNLAAHLDEAEKNFKSEKGGETERVQAGDLVGASPANSALLQDEPTIKVFNQMNFTLGTLGNHEFDKGLGEFHRILKGLEPASGQFEGDLGEIVNGYEREPSKQEIVIANIVNKSDGKIPYGFEPYTTRSYSNGNESVKVAYMGIITSEFPNLVLAEHTKDYDVLDEAETIAKYSKLIREKEKVDAIVLITHLSAVSDANGNVSGEVATVLDKVNQIYPDNSIDVVFAGHNHQHTNGVYENGENKTRVVQSTAQGKAYIDLQGELDPETKDFVDVPEAEVKPTTDRPDKNAEVQKTVDHASELIKKVTESKIATAAEGVTTITKDVNAHSESPLGNLIVDAQLYMANDIQLKDAAGNPVTVDFAMTNNGGIRADLTAQPDGAITWGAVQAVQPFGNILQVVALSGQTIRDVLNEQHKNGKLHYFLQIAGLSFTYQGVGDDFEVVEIKDSQGKELDPEKMYNVVINDFLFGGGDGFKSFTKGKLVAAMDTDTSTFVSYFEKMEKEGKKITAPALGRKLEVGEEVPSETEETEEPGTTETEEPGTTETEEPGTTETEEPGTTETEEPGTTETEEPGTTESTEDSKETEKNKPLDEATKVSKTVLVGGVIKGESLPGAEVSITLPNGEVHHVTVGKDGKFSFDIRGFDLKKDDTLKLHFIKDDMMVERDIVVTNETAQNGGASGSNNSNNKKPGYLPQTGEEAAPFALAGLAIVGGVLTIVMVRKKNEVK
ncbi:5'-nucleotidase C-terminal domain-containing protein [Vagococcus lutrae]|uniref:5'-nucleotidase C-terminal domain-containing protein n=1 Tax=Vagococcus lutrae TaxID=81947 RepID=UPI00200EF66D|nr:5'-nucleotidase C-terminal domain-containing protein [Vagococcus lutrae]UQF18442.1 5'-nucleotidase C-terminal domain-containing protein [Vagococcus lutrae]